MLLIHLYRESKIPLFRQVVDQIKEMIDNNTLRQGDKLPSTRQFAKQLGVSRTTIYHAYEELWSLGYIESRPGSYSIVLDRKKVVTLNNRKRKKRIDWNKISAFNCDHLVYLLNKQNKGKEHDNTIDFVTLCPDPRLSPTEEFRKCLNRLLVNEGATHLQCDDPMGFKPLREFIIDQMRYHSMYVTSDEILITNGAQQAIDLILKLLVVPGGNVITESPTYFLIIPLLKYYNAKIVGIPVDENGMKLDTLKEFIQTNHPALIYTIPNFHNPTGITTSQSHRQELLSICEKNRIPLVEDGFVEEMKYFGKSVLPIKSMDQYNIIFYIGTFSKVLFPGLRIGWIAADRECIRKLCAIKFSQDITSNRLSQAALNYFCREGYYELHIRRMHRIYRRRMQTALRAAKEYIPHDYFSYTSPSGGYLIWVEGKNTGLREEELIRHINKRGVAVLPGRLFFPEPSDTIGFRISIAQRDENEIEEGIKRIGNTLRDLL